MNDFSEYLRRSKREYDRLSAIRRVYDRGYISDNEAVNLLCVRCSVPKDLTRGVVGIWRESLLSKKLLPTRGEIK